MMRVAAGLCCLLCLVAPLRASQGTLLDPQVRALLHEELSGELAKENVIAITRHHRIQASRGYLQAAEWVLAQLRAHGFDEEHAWIESYPSDGKIHYQTWQSPSGWHIESAELRMVAPRDERIVGFPEIAMSVVTYSNAGDVTAELVDVGAGTSESDYAGKDVKGKFVLASGYGGAVHRLAVLEHGAAAVVCYLADERAAEHPDMLQYTGMWPKPDELERTTFGFNLTNRQGEMLRALLAAGEKVVLHGKVEGPGLEAFTMDVVVAKIDGATKPGQELLFSAHLDHPKESANDNASGSGAILDIARGLRKLIDEKRLPAPQRTLRFLWVPEWYGTMAYLDGHAEVLGPARWALERADGSFVLANVNLDMVGEDTELLHSRLILTKSPLAVPGPLDAVIGDMARMVEALDVRTPRGSRGTFAWRQTPFSGGSDHMMFLDRGIPSVMFSHDPDYTHHTSEDTPDKVDPVELERCELIATGALWYLANLSEREALDLVWAVSAETNARFDEAVSALRGRLEGLTPEALAVRVVEADVSLSTLGKLLGATAFRSLAPYMDSLARASPSWPGVMDELDRAFHARVNDARMALSVEYGNVRPRFRVPGDMEMADDLTPLLERVQPYDERTVVRRTRGPLAFDLPERALPPDRASWYSSKECPFPSSEQRFELLNFASAGLSLGSIRAAYSAELGYVTQGDVNRFFEDLQSVNLVELRAPERATPGK
jgi:aminopeptidase YwaD